MSGNNVLTMNDFPFVQEELCWVRAGRLASRTLSLCPVQIYGHRGLATPTGYGNHVIRLVLHVFKAQKHYFVKLPEQNFLVFSRGGYSLDGNYFYRYIFAFLHIL